MKEIHDHSSDRKLLIVNGRFSYYYLFEGLITFSTVFQSLTTDNKCIQKHKCNY